MILAFLGKRESLMDIEPECGSELNASFRKISTFLAEFSVNFYMRFERSDGASQSLS